MKAYDRWISSRSNTAVDIRCVAEVFKYPTSDSYLIDLRLLGVDRAGQFPIRMSVEEAEKLMVDLARVLQCSKPDTSEDCVGCNGGTKRPIQVAYTQTGEEYCYHCGRDCKDS